MSMTNLLKGIFGWGNTRPRNYRPEEDPALDSSFSNPVEYYHNEMELSRSKRRDRYDVYDAMDKLPDVSSVLDAYAEDATQIDMHTNLTTWIESEDNKIKKELTYLFDRVNIEEFIEGLTRDVAKQGDDFARVIGDEKEGVSSIEWWDPRDIERVENRDGVLLGYEPTATLNDYKNKLSDDPDCLPSFKPWEFIHWRIYKMKRLPNEKYRNIYGTSLLWSSDRIAKQVKILDDLLMIIRLTRSLDRKVYYIDVGMAPVEEEVRILKKWRNALKRRSYTDPVSGRFDSRFDPYGFTADEFWPVKDGSNSKVETINGMGNVGDMVDIDHFRDKFFGSLRAPKAYFGYEGDVNAKATLSSQSLKWARAVNSLQRAVKQGLTRLCQIHLAYKGIDPDATKFDVMMVLPSVIELIDRLEAWSTIVEVAEKMSGLGETLQLNKSEWKKYILENVLWLSKDQISKVAEGESLPDSGEDDKLPDDEPESDVGDTEDGDPDYLSHLNVSTTPSQPTATSPDKDMVITTQLAGESRNDRLIEIDRAISKVISRRVTGAKKIELPRRYSKI